MVAVCVDSIARNHDVLTRLQLGFPILSDPTLATTRAFGVEDAQNGIAWPAVFVIGTDGRVRWRSLADEVAHRPSSSELLAVIDRAS